jgi:uncharacterized tellurite resistance protein B-like protein
LSIVKPSRRGTRASWVDPQGRVFKASERRLPSLAMLPASRRNAILAQDHENAVQPVFIPRTGSWCLRMMFDRLAALFGDDALPAPSEDRLPLAAAVLLVEAARMDGHFDDDERQTIHALLRWRFEMPDDDVRALIAAADAEADHLVELSTYARTIKDRLPHDERVELIEMMWTVVYADGRLDDYEANLMRRVAGLLYVSDMESGAARKRVLERLDLDGDTE